MELAKLSNLACRMLARLDFICYCMGNNAPRLISLLRTRRGAFLHCFAGQPLNLITLTSATKLDIYHVNRFLKSEINKIPTPLCRLLYTVTGSPSFRVGSGSCAV